MLPRPTDFKRPCQDDNLTTRNQLLPFPVLVFQWLGQWTVAQCKWQKQKWKLRDDIHFRLPARAHWTPFDPASIREGTTHTPEFYSRPADMGWNPKPQLSETRGSGAAFPKIKDGVRAKPTPALDSQSKASPESRHVVPRSALLPAPRLWVSASEGPLLPNSRFLLHLFQLFSWILIRPTCEQ